MARRMRIDRDLLVRVVKLLKRARNIEASYNPEFGYELNGAALDIEKILGNPVEVPDLPGPPDPPRAYPRPAQPLYL